MMVDKIVEQQDSGPGGTCPYDQLYIYYLNGRAKTDASKMGPDFIGNWVEDGFSFLFFSQPSAAMVQQLLDSQKDLTLIDQYIMGYNEWLGEKPEPVHIGRFIIAPPWVPAASYCLTGSDAFPILLDPGVVFGTGTHPTTRNCLELLDMAVNNGPTDRVLDLGCGTGLLALAAAKLGCSKILAVDFNELAVETTWRNVRLNKLENQILAVQGMAEEMTDIAADLLIANIHYDVMEKIIRSPGFVTKKQFILSGLLTSQAAKVTEILSELPVTIRETRAQNGVWHTFYGVCE